MFASNNNNERSLYIDSYEYVFLSGNSNQNKLTTQGLTIIH